MLPTASPKPARGTARLERNARKRMETAHADRVKRQAKKRDHRRCRFPRCEMQRQGFVLDGAHIKAAGMGGNPDLSRLTTGNILSVCRIHHRGTFSMHSGDIKVMPQTDAGADGVVDWWVTDEQTGWKWVGCS